MAIERGRGSSRHSHQSHHYRYVKPLGERIKDCCRSTIAFIFSNVGVCGLMVGYTIMGAFLFRMIEGSGEIEQMKNVEEIRNRTIAQLWDITVEYNVLYKTNWTSKVGKVVNDYQQEIIAAVADGWGGSDNGNYTQWSLEGGFLYSLTVITTIGYGHISPNTDVGKIVTILYAIFGLPVFLLYMANMGDILAKSLKWTYSKLCMCRRPEPKFEPSVAWRSAEATLRAPLGAVAGVPDVTTYQGGGNPRQPGLEYPPEMSDEISIETTSWRSGRSDKGDLSTVNIPITVSLVIMVALLYGGTMLFQEYEGWDLLTSFYFCFISLTTIGFGDFVPGASTGNEEGGGSRISFIYCSLYLMFGLALLSMCFNLMQEEVVHKITACLKSIRIFKRDTN